MFAVKIFIVIVIVPYVYSQQMSSVDSKSYGPYKVWWRHYDLCSGPKRENLTHIASTLLVEKDIYKGVMNLSFLANTRIDEIKITVTAVKNSDTKNLLWNYKVGKPCQHFALAFVLKQHLDISHNCVVKKGDYYCIVDFTDSTYRFLGSSFFYGEYIFKVVLLSKKGNIACLMFNSVFEKI